MAEIDLSFIPTDDLMQELKNRFKAFTGIGVKTHPYEDDSNIYDYIFKGEIYEQIGLAVILEEFLSNAFFDTNREPFEDEDL